MDLGPDYKLNYRGAVVFLLMKKLTPFHESEYQCINVNNGRQNSIIHSSLFYQTDVKSFRLYCECHISSTSEQNDPRGWKYRMHHQHCCELVSSVLAIKSEIISKLLTPRRLLLVWFDLKCLVEGFYFAEFFNVVIKYLTQVEFNKNIFTNSFAIIF